MPSEEFSVPPVPCPPRPAKSYLPFIYILPEQTLTCEFVTARWWSCYTHFTNPHTTYCPAGTRGRCVETCPPGNPRWTAYAVVAVGRAGTPHLLQWHQHAHLWCPRLDVLQGSLIAQAVKLTRNGIARNSPLSIELIDGRVCDRLPVVEDVRAYLSRLWNIAL
jgi:hypothetical protein